MNEIDKVDYPLTSKDEGAIISAGKSLNILFTTLCAFRPRQLNITKQHPGLRHLVLESFKQGNVENMVGACGVPLVAMSGQTVDLMTIVPGTVNRLSIRNHAKAPVLLFLALEGNILRGEKLFKKLRYTFDERADGLTLCVTEDER